VNKQLYEDLQEFVDKVKWDVFPEQNAIRFSISMPEDCIFSDKQDRLNQEALSSFLKDCIDPALTEIFREYNNKELTEELLIDIRSCIDRKDAERISDGKLSFKDEIRSRLGLLPDLSKFIAGTIEINV